MPRQNQHQQQANTCDLHKLVSAQAPDSPKASLGAMVTWLQVLQGAACEDPRSPRSHLGWISSHRDRGVGDRPPAVAHPEWLGSPLLGGSGSDSS